MDETNGGTRTIIRLPDVMAAGCEEGVEIVLLETTERPAAAAPRDAAPRREAAAAD